MAGPRFACWLDVAIFVRWVIFWRSRTCSNIKLIPNVFHVFGVNKLFLAWKMQYSPILRLKYTIIIRLQLQRVPYVICYLLLVLH